MNWNIEWGKWVIAQRGDELTDEELKAQLTLEIKQICDLLDAREYRKARIYVSSILEVYEGMKDE